MPDRLQCRFCGTPFEGDNAAASAQEHEQACPARLSAAESTVVSQGSGSGVPPSGPQAEAVPRPSALRNVFFNRRELRAGWRFAIYVVLLIMFGLGLTAATAWILHPSPGVFRPLSTQAFEFAMFVAAIIPAMILGRFERRSLAHYGLPAGRAFGRRFWEGCLFGLGSVTLLMFMMRGVHAFYFGHIALHGTHILKWAAFWGVFFVWVGFFEEFAFRGYTLFTLTTGMGFWPAAVLLSILFGAVHLGNPGEAWVGGLSAGLIGLFLAFSFRRTGSLWWAVGFHQAFDWGETFLYSVPNSGMNTPGHLLNSYFHGPRWLTGGTIGPEGSVLVFLLILLLFVVFDRLYRTVQFPPADAGGRSPAALVENPGLVR
jgi:membrane protease YdiL (CAAX protease family)